MKKYFFVAAVLSLGFVMVACNDEEEIDTTKQTTATTQTNQPEADVTAVLDFEGTAWSALIDDPQNNGPLLYGTAALDYGWSDDATGLSSKLTLAWGGTFGFAEGGIAISNYIDNDLANHADYNYQLAVPISNGSNNFAVVYCTASMQFPEGVSRLIRTIDIAPTTYELGVAKNGNGSALPLTDAGSYLTLTVTADNGNKLTIDMARDGEFLETWRTIDFTSLGRVNKLTFTMDGSDQAYGFVNTPVYFAMDNIIVDL